jgi:hypothetical protein
VSEGRLFSENDLRRGHDAIVKHSSEVGSSSFSVSSFSQFRMESSLRQVKVRSDPSSVSDKNTRCLQSRIYNALSPGSRGHWGSENMFEITNEFRELGSGVVVGERPATHTHGSPAFLG